MATLRFVDKSLSVFVGNISTVVPHEKVEEVIYELFLQVSYILKEETLVPPLFCLMPYRIIHSCHFFQGAHVALLCITVYDFRCYSS